MKAIVTGGAGFIGSHVVDELLKRGHSTAIIDDLSSTNGNLRNIGHLKNSENVRFYRADITDRNEMLRIFSSEKPDYIFHLAAQVSVAVSMKDPEHDMKTNLEGSRNIIDASIQAGAKKIIYSGSGGTVYGDYYTKLYKDPLNIDINELDRVAPDEAKPIAPISPYGKSKAAVIDLLRKQDKIAWTTLLYSNVYGPRQDPHGEAGVIAIFCEKMINGQRPTIFGKGICIRDYVYGPDVARANILAIEQGNKELINIGTNKGQDVNRIYAIIKETVGFVLDAIQAPYREGDVLVNIVDIKKAKEILGWSPEVGLESGLAKTVKYFQDLKSKNN